MTEATTTLTRAAVGGRIRAGMKILKRSAAQKPLVKQIYDEGLAQGATVRRSSDQGIQRTIAACLIMRYGQVR